MDKERRDPEVRPARHRSVAAALAPRCCGTTTEPLRMCQDRAHAQHPVLRAEQPGATAAALPARRRVRPGGRPPALLHRPLTAPLCTHTAEHRDAQLNLGGGAAQVAGNRYAIFGKSDTLRLSDADQATRFLS